MSRTYRTTAMDSRRRAVSRRSQRLQAVLPLDALTCEHGACTHIGQLVPLRGLDSLMWPCYCSEHATDAA